MTRTKGGFVLAVGMVLSRATGAAQQPGASVPITLSQAVGEAIDHNLSLLAERFNVTIAAAAVVTAKASQPGKASKLCFKIPMRAATASTIRAAVIYPAQTNTIVGRIVKISGSSSSSFGVALRR